MAAWPDLSYIRTEVRYHLDEATASLWSDAELNRHINDAQRDIAAKTGCMITTVAATTTTGSRLVPFIGHKVQYAEYVPASGPPIGLISITPKMLGNVQFNDGIIPQYCFQWGQNLVIDPVPQAVYNLNLYVSQYPEYDMSAATDEPVIPLEFHDMIPYYAASMAFLKARRAMSASAMYKFYIGAAGLYRKIYIDPMPDKHRDIKLPDIVEEPQNVE